MIVRGDQELIYVEFRQGDSKSPLGCWCVVGHPPAMEMWQSLVWFALKFGLFGLAAVVLWNRPRDEGTWRFFLLCTVTIGAFMGGYHWLRIAGTPVLVVLFIICAVMLPVASLHFYLNFPTPKRFLQRRRILTLFGLYAVPVTLLALMLTTYLVLVYTYRQTVGGTSLGAVRNLLRFLLTIIIITLSTSAILFGGCVASLIHSYATTRPGSRERNQVKWILTGALLASIPIGYAIFMAITDSDQFGVGGTAWPMFFASLCITLGYGISISRYGLLEVGQVLNWGIVNLAVSVAAGLVYSLLVFLGTFLIGTNIEHLSAFRQAAWVSITSWLLLLGLDVFRWRLRKTVDRALHRDKHQLEKTLQRMSQTVDQMVDAPALCKRLLNAVSELLSFRLGAVYSAITTRPFGGWRRTWVRPRPTASWPSGRR